MRLHVSPGLQAGLKGLDTRCLEPMTHLDRQVAIAFFDRLCCDGLFLETFRSAWTKNITSLLSVTVAIRWFFGISGVHGGKQLRKQRKQPLATQAFFLSSSPARALRNWRKIGQRRSALGARIFGSSGCPFGCLNMAVVGKHFTLLLVV